MSIASVSVTTAVTTILADNRNRRAFALKSLSTNTDTIYLKFDGSTTALTTANGYPLAAGESLIVGSGIGLSGVDAGFAIKGIVATTTCDLRVQEL